MQAPDPIHLTRTDPACNMARFYHLELQPDLFGGIRLVRSWGRIGGSGEVRQSWFPSLLEAEGARGGWLRRKLARGYMTD
ncbi:WGR domain-containing protein (plasmid) [Paracoccus saliphilus]|uniref:WGR domain-containing protein n=3 Tax=Paracoccus saliphilus TaxID=405559 RepID=A0ABY7SF34_9RHOB|nr:WGR domain-containing protein [Paracoccus saliphilus]WCR05553.1 WGR domain-containing protein [Paracoccus saliphilus]